MTPETRAAKLMTVLPMVLTPLLLEKPNFTKETKQFASSCRVRRSVSETEGRPGCPGTFCRLERIRMLVMTPGRSKGGSAIARSRAQRSTRPWRRTGLRISGESELEGARQRPGNLADSFALRMALSPLDREHGGLYGPGAEGEHQDRGAYIQSTHKSPGLKEPHRAKHTSNTRHCRFWLGWVTFPVQSRPVCPNCHIG